MMKAFLNKEDPAVKPLLASKTSSSSNKDKATTKAALLSSRPLKTLLSPLSLPAAMIRTTTPTTSCSTVHSSPDNSPTTKHHHQGRKKDPSYRVSSQQQHSRDIVSPTAAITLNRRSATLPTVASVSVLSTLQIKKTRSEDISRSSISGRTPRSHVCNNYKPALEYVHEDFGVEHAQLAALSSLRKPQLNHSREHHRSASRGRANTYPDGMIFLPIQKQAKVVVAHGKKKSAPVDVDEVSRDLSYCTNDYNKGDRRSSSLDALGHLDTERLLGQMGMDVTKEDYCIEGSEEFIANNSRVRKNHTRKTKSRCHSYDCNYNHPLETAYEDFGVERRLGEFKQRPEREEAHGKNMMARVGSMRRMVRNRLGTIGNNNHSEWRNSSRNQQHDDHHHVHDKSPNNNKVLKSKVLSILRGNGNRHTSAKDKIPQQIIATTITPTSSEDNNDCPITPDDMQLLYRWQTARSSMRGVGGSSNNQIGSKKKYEDVLSITGSCGDETVHMDNRRRHRSMVSC